MTDQNSRSKSPASVLALTNLSLSNEKEKDEDVDIIGFIDTSFCTSSKTLASVLGSMVGDALKYPSDEKRYLVQQFSVYFSEIGWKTEGCMTASAGTPLPI